MIELFVLIMSSVPVGNPGNDDFSEESPGWDIFVLFSMMDTSRDVVTLMMGLDLSSTTVEEENAPTSKSKK